MRAHPTTTNFATQDTVLDFTTQDHWTELWDTSLDRNLETQHTSEAYNEDIMSTHELAKNKIHRLLHRTFQANTEHRTDNGTGRTRDTFRGTPRTLDCTLGHGTDGILD